MCFINSSSSKSGIKEPKKPRSSARARREGGIRLTASGCYIRKKTRDVDVVAVHASLVCCNETASRRASGQLLGFIASRMYMYDGRGLGLAQARCPSDEHCIVDDIGQVNLIAAYIA